MQKIPNSSSFEPDVVCMLCVCHTTPTEAVLFAFFRQVGPPQQVDAWPQVGNSIKCLSQGHSDALPHRQSNQDFATFRLLARFSSN